jgi:hypothetical protein
MSERYLGDSRRSLELRRRFSLPPEMTWLTLEETITSDPQGLELLEVWGEDPAGGSLAIFEASGGEEKEGTLRFWASAADVKRFMVQVLPVAGEGCEVVIRAPLRRSRRVGGGVGALLSGLGAAVGGGTGLGLTALTVAAAGIAGVPLALLGGGLIVGGTVGGGQLARAGTRRLHRWAIGSLEDALKKLLTRVERHLQRESRSRLGPG